LHPAKFPPWRRGKVDIYVGQLETPGVAVAIIESEAYAYIDDDVRNRQIEQLITRARALGANTVQDIRYLTKRVRGYTATNSCRYAWKQGQYELIFCEAPRPRARTEPKRFDEIEPLGGGSSIH
jgi:hypothetical protein